ncbi:protein kinase [Micromonospora sp. CPCC 205711]
MLTRGVLLGDRYRLSERVATGGMGAVWRCVDTLLEREVAVKVMLPELLEDPEFSTRFHAEARMLAALRHPGIVAVHDFGTATLADGSRVSYLVMAYVDGEPLSAWVRRAGRLDPASTMSVVAQAAGALHAAHLAGIVHRDVKPANLLVGRDGSVVLVDFGIARSTATAGITAAHMVLGTASYMSPEQAIGQPVSPATDTYALGALAYFCLAGRPPFAGDNPLQVALRHAQDAPPPLPPDTPPAVAAVVERALAKRPADRWPSAQAFAEAALDARDATLAVLPAPPRPPWALGGPQAVPAPVGTPTGGRSTGGGIPTGGANTGGDTPTGGGDTPTGGGGTPTGGGGTGTGGVAPTREDQAGPSARRRLALVAVGGVVAALAVAGGALAAFGPDEPAAGRGPELTAESAVPAPAVPSPGVTRAGGRPRPTGSPTGSRPPSAPADGPAPAATRPVAGPTGTAAATADPVPGATTTTAPAPGATTTRPATPNPYTAGQVCGSGYQVIDSATLTAGGTRQGRVYLLWNEAAKANCVVTLKETAVGEPTAASAYLEVQGRARETDSGPFEYYAGPVRAGAAGACVRWGGSTGGASYGSAFEHCA